MADPIVILIGLLVAAGTGLILFGTVFRRAPG
jgi:hypothetical protein